MVSSKSQKTYTYYLNCYLNWCKKNSFNREDSLPKYRLYLENANRSTGYIKNCINTISKLAKIPQIRGKNIKRQRLQSDELNMIRDFCKRHYDKEELSLIILLNLETGLNIKRILNLTKADIENAVVKEQLSDKKEIPHSSVYLFEYLLSTSYQKELNEKYFTKTYHAYLYTFKKRQEELFPKKHLVSFNGLKSKNPRSKK